MSQLQITKTSELSWMDITNASDKEIDYLRKKYNFIAQDLADSLAHKHAQRPKIMIRPDYIFIVILFPVYNRKTREITPAEIDVFITADHLITIHYNQVKPLMEFFKLCSENKHERDSYLNDTTVMLLHEILDRIYLSLFPMIDHFSLDINNIEKNIFASKERDMVHEILIIKRNIVYFRKIMQSHLWITNKLIEQKLNRLTNGRETKIFYRDLIDYIQDIWNTLNSYQATIDALEDTNNALVTFKLNDIMRTLTIFSVIVFPLTLMAAVFGMNVRNMPIVGSDFDFWQIIVIMLIATIAMASYFKHKKWI